MRRWLFKIIKALVRLFYPEIEIVGKEKLEGEDIIVVANHAQLHSPIACELYFPDKFYTWCAGEMMTLRDVPAYAFRDFWSDKKKSVRWLFKIASYLIAPLSVLVFNNARTIPVYHEKKVINTFRMTLKSLCDGRCIVIFPEHAVKHNNIVYDFQDRFIDVAKVYFNKSGRRVRFLPMYVAPKLKKAVIGEEILFNPEADDVEERARIKEYLMSSITELAISLPEHTVVPYLNIPKKDYPKNITKEREYEKADS